jgi:hypothetical protein
LSPRTVVKFFLTGRSLQFPKITNKTSGNSLSPPPLALLCSLLCDRRCPATVATSCCRNSTRHNPLAPSPLAPLSPSHRRQGSSIQIFFSFLPSCFFSSAGKRCAQAAAAPSGARRASRCGQARAEAMRARGCGSTRGRRQAAAWVERAHGRRTRGLASPGRARAGERSMQAERAAAARVERVGERAQARRRASGPRRWCGAGSERRHSLGGSAHRSRRRAAGASAEQACGSGSARLEASGGRCGCGPGERSGWQLRWFGTVVEQRCARPELPTPLSSIFPHRRGPSSGPFPRRLTLKTDFR